MYTLTTQPTGEKKLFLGLFLTYFIFFIESETLNEGSIYHIHGHTIITDCIISTKFEYFITSGTEGLIKLWEKVGNILTEEWFGKNYNIKNCFNVFFITITIN